MSNESPNIYQRVLNVMKDVQYIQKEEKRVNNQYTFVSHDAVSRVLHPKLVEYGIAVIPTLVNSSVNGNRTETVVDVDFVNVDAPEDRFTVRSLGYGIDPQDKGPGKAVSYACKYAMLKTFVLETGDDPERDLIEHDPGKSNVKGVKGLEEKLGNGLISDEQKNKLYELAAENKRTKAQMKGILKHFNFESSEEITKDKFDAICKQVEAEGVFAKEG